MPMQISIQQPDLEQFVEEQVKSGQYPSAEAVVENALRALQTQQMNLPSGEELRRLIAEGQAAADRGEFVDGDKFFDELLARNAERPREA